MDAAVSSDAPPPADAGKAVSSVWQRTLATTSASASEVQVSWAHAFDDKVFVAGTPDVVLYSAEGSELARTPAPPQAVPGFVWATGVIRRPDGTIAVAYRDTVPNVFVQEYGDVDLAPGPRTDLSASGTQHALVEAAGLLRVLSFHPDGGNRLELQTLAGGAIQSTATAAVDTSYWLRGAGLATDAGGVLFCGVAALGGDAHRVELLEFSASDELMVHSVHDADVAPGPCSVVVYDGNYFVSWTGRDGSALRVAVATVGTDKATIVQAASFIGGPLSNELLTGVSIQADRALFMERPSAGLDDIRIVRYDLASSTELPDCFVRLAPDAVTDSYGAVFAASGDAAYAAFTASYGVGMTDLRLRRVTP